MAGQQGARGGAGRRRPWRPLRYTGPAIPHRSTDRLEDLTDWVLVSLGLLAVVGAILVGRAAHHAVLDPGRRGEVSPVRVTLLADAPSARAAGQSIRAPLPPVPVSWTSTDGTEQTGELLVRAPLAAGTAFTAWRDRDGRLTASPPRHGAEAVVFGVGAALTTGALAWVLLVALWLGVHRLTTARNDALWTREWARVEPVWSRQTR